MDPSEENNQEQSISTKKKSNLIPAILLFFLLAFICGAGFYFYSGSKATDPAQSLSQESVDEKQNLPPSLVIELERIEPVDESDKKENEPVADSTPLDITSPTKDQDEKVFTQEAGLADIEEPLQDAVAPLSEAEQMPQKVEDVSICDKPTQQLNEFYRHLDSQPYMADFKLSTTSKNHFTALGKKLLANPPQVTRESDDLYTILKNTAHFFRISGKDNILMMKGILDNEKGRIEQILADYYILVTNQDCDGTSYGSGIDKDALYEYACFFLNTMGGRLYLFRRDSLSRMAVTYYAILLVDLANTENNNRHGIALKSAIDMLIAEMETGGSALIHSELYLDNLYDLKEKYQ